MDKQTDKYIIIVMLIVSFLVALAKAISDDAKVTVRNLLLQGFIGAVSGLLFGSLAVWVIGENIYAAITISGVGAVMGMKGLEYLAKAISERIIKKIKND